ncbi:uncharacterized protein LOC133860333 [Alnus glutinosa]|uniref:uncharacterized protein LOC133860333 n=1 Tax=Alnus glutinosa TaxID=3517 RepID=UPI002D7681FC|nr:uncharacterized protein LOC133860333 [Alnus glutinosa]
MTIRPQRQMSAFLQALDESDLADLGFSRPRFTWCNGRSEGHHMRERLDRAVANGSWSSLFNVVQVTILTPNILDHHPFLVAFPNTKDIQWTKSRRFRYEASWTKHCDLQEVVKKVWKAKQSVSDPWKVYNNLTRCRRTLKQWVRKKVHPVEEQIQNKEEELLALQLQDHPDLPKLEAPIYC